jgi:cytosine/adenosine deaminase-related metal-dependent hydrolase
MGIRIWLRNGFFYGLFMPNLCDTHTYLFHSGFGEIYIYYSLLKALVTGAAHSELRWDSFLYRFRFLNPLAWLLEHTISTPATHFAHHALNEEDGIGKLNGNYGNLLFVWDQLFGTALITRKYPPAFGLIEDIEHGAEKWHIQLFYPLCRSKRHVSNKKIAQPLSTQNN